MAGLMTMMMMVAVMILPWDKSALASEFSHVESIVVHLTENCDDVSSAERKLNL